MNTHRATLLCALVAACLLATIPQINYAAGGCGSICLPLEAMDPEKTQLRDQAARVGVVVEHAKFDNFREGDSDITNMGGNSAVITQATFFIDYGVSKRFTASVLLPYINKNQETNKFGERVAKGLADVSVFGRYSVLVPVNNNGPLVALGLGIKFPTGDIEEPSTSNRLPPAFQAGSGAYDIIPTASYFQDFGAYSLFGSTFYRIPLEKNRLGYRFGREFELNVGARYPLPSAPKLALLLSLSLLHAEHDRDFDAILPPRLRDGDTVLNTGGRFIDIVPGVRWQVTRKLSAQLRFAIPIKEDWNGDRATNVGQVAQDLTTMFTLISDM